MKPQSDRQIVLHRVRRVAMALFNGLLTGSWAAFANYGAGPAVALRAAATQCAFTFAGAIFLLLILERLFRWPATPERGFWLAAVGTPALGAATLAVGHALAGTPHIAATIAPPVLAGTVMCVIYARAMLIDARRQRDISALN